MFYCTRLDWEAWQILSSYAARWAIEVTYENSKQLLGRADPATRTPLAVARPANLTPVLASSSDHSFASIKILGSALCMKALSHDRPEKQECSRSEPPGPGAPASRRTS